MGRTRPLPCQVKCLSEVDFVQIFWFESAPSLRSGPDVEYGSIFHKKSLMVFYFDTFHKQVFVHFKTFFMFLWLKLMIILIIKKSKKKFPEP